MVGWEDWKQGDGRVWGAEDDAVSKKQDEDGGRRRKKREDREHGECLEGLLGGLGAG